MDIRKQTMIVERTGSRRFSRPSLKGARLLGSSVKSALGNTASFRQKHSDLKEDDSDADSGFFHDDEAVRASAMDMFWSQHVHVTKVGKTFDETDVSSTGFSDTLSDESNHSLIKSAHTTKTVHRHSYNEMNASNRSTVSAKTLDLSDLHGAKDKKKKEKVPKRIDFTGNIVDSDDEEEDNDDDALSGKSCRSGKSKSSKRNKKKKKKSNKKSSTKKKKKCKKGVRITTADVSDDDAVVSGSAFEDTLNGFMVSGTIEVRDKNKTLASEETKVEDDAVADLIFAPKPSLYRRQTTSGTAASAFSADPSITLVMERIALEDEKYSDRQARMELEQEIEELLEENNDLHAELEEELQRNEKLEAELSRMETKLQTVQLKPLNQDDMEILHQEIQRLQEELNERRMESDKLSMESRSKIAELQQTVDSLRDEALLAQEEASLARAEASLASSNPGLNISSHSENGKSVERLQGELLIANSKVENLEKVRMEQHGEIRKLRHLLDRLKEKLGVKELEDKLEESEKETSRLRSELNYVEKDWEEKVRSKEETIEYFRRELSLLKLQQISSSCKLTQTEIQDVLRVDSEGVLEDNSGQPRRSFRWLRGSGRNRREV